MNGNITGAEFITEIVLIFHVQSFLFQEIIILLVQAC